MGRFVSRVPEVDRCGDASTVIDLEGISLTLVGHLAHIQTEMLSGDLFLEQCEGQYLK